MAKRKGELVGTAESARAARDLRLLVLDDQAGVQDVVVRDVTRVEVLGRRAVTRPGEVLEIVNWLRAGQEPFDAPPDLLWIDCHFGPPGGEIDPVGLFYGVVIASMAMPTLSGRPLGFAVYTATSKKLLAGREDAVAYLSVLAALAGRVPDPNQVAPEFFGEMFTAEPPNAVVTSDSEAVLGVCLPMFRSSLLDLAERDRVFFDSGKLAQLVECVAGASAEWPPDAAQMAVVWHSANGEREAVRVGSMFADCFLAPADPLQEVRGRNRAHAVASAHEWLKAVVARPDVASDFVRRLAKRLDVLAQPSLEALPQWGKGAADEERMGAYERVGMALLVWAARYCTARYNSDKSPAKFRNPRERLGTDSRALEDLHEATRLSSTQLNRALGVVFALRAKKGGAVDAETRYGGSAFLKLIEARAKASGEWPFGEGVVVRLAVAAYLDSRSDEPAFASRYRPAFLET